MTKLSIVSKLNNIFTKIKNNIKNNYQFYLFMITVLIAIINLIYALGFGTGWATAEEYGTKNSPTEISLYGDFVHNYNMSLLKFSLLIFVLIFINLLISVTSRKKFSIYNYVFIGLFSLLYFINAFIILNSINKIYDKTIALEEYSKTHTSYLFLAWFNGNNESFETIYKILKLGNFVAVLSIFSSAVLIMLIIIKILERKSVIKYRNLLKSLPVVNDTVSADENELIPLSFDQPRYIISDFKTDKMRYQPNKLWYSITLLSILFFLVAIFKSINYSLHTGLDADMKVIPDFKIALDILISILLLLLTFLTAEKIKIYSKKWSIFLIVIAAINFLRIFNIPLYILKQNMIPKNEFILIIIFYAITIVAQFISGLMSYFKSSRLFKYLQENGEI